MGDNNKPPPEPESERGVQYLVIDKDGNIGMVFDHPIGFFSMPPLQAIALGIAIIQVATNRIAGGPPSNIIKLRDM